jgi:hypothetical protein
MYVNGMGFRAIERVTEINHNTIINGGFQAAHNAPDAPKAPTIPEITEVRLCIAMEKFWSLQLEAELQFINLLTTYIV